MSICMRRYTLAEREPTYVYIERAYISIYIQRERAYMYLESLYTEGPYAHCTHYTHNPLQCFAITIPFRGVYHHLAFQQSRLRTTLAHHLHTCAGLSIRAHTDTDKQSRLRTGRFNVMLCALPTDDGDRDDWDSAGQGRPTARPTASR